MAEDQCTKSWNVNAAVWAGCAEEQLLGTAGGGEEVGKRQGGCRKPGREALTTVRRKREVAKILELSGSKIKLRGRTRRIYISLYIKHLSPYQQTFFGTTLRVGGLKRNSRERT